MRRLFKLLFAGFDRMTMVRHKSSSVLLRGRNRKDLPKVTNEDYSDRARLSTLPAFMRVEGRAVRSSWAPPEPFPR